ncbi:putative transposase YdaD [Thermosporothrix hazakensis]|jgi:predicted transposase YdaD|uniref:Transposase (putative) YhgA-like domain-containing protein n=2 Tax=Thermosporothrix TaxID=768650 RepID=A0A455SSF7_9CHLR|nr:hypothetical protein [Thermosporothrix hazakensis]PZW18242.1 putative transposase YdaD [Thermosporothrix hazakensis]BBH90556.1 hypothetical protein KTC_53070 [Thermosporothrix sp. COM3]GCE48609.1 hypothetical protein KTH_34780 [Thermosporothrix hazakensis]
MGKEYDKGFKVLIQQDPERFVNWLIAGAHFVDFKNGQLNTLQLDVDALMEIEVDGVHMLLHVEFQATHRRNMPMRILRYNVLVRCAHELPVLSCVIYLYKDGGKPEESPLIWQLPTGQEVLRFHYMRIALWELSPEDIWKQGQKFLLPLLPLTRGGANQAVVERMLEELHPEENKELALIGFSLATSTFKRLGASADLSWLIRRYHMLNDILRDSPIFQLIEQEGIEKGRREGIEKGRREGIEKGRREGIEKGRIETSRHTALAILQARFPQQPALHALAQRVLAGLVDLSLLQQLPVRFSTVSSPEEAQQLLLSLKPDYGS